MARCTISKFTIKIINIIISMDIETTFYEYLKKYAENKTSVKCFNLKHISLLPPDYA